MGDQVFVRVERIRAIRAGCPQQRWHWPASSDASQVSVGSPKGQTPPIFKPDLIGNKEPPLEVGRANTLPAAEAGWEDAHWRDVPVWNLLRDEPLARRPRLPTELKLLHDGRTLAILARCTESNSVIAHVREHDADMDGDDTFQVYLATTGSTYVQLVVNPLGVLLDAAGKTGSLRMLRPHEWESGARVTVRPGANMWTVRMDVPLEPIAKVLGESGLPVRWRVLFCARGLPGPVRHFRGASCP